MIERREIESLFKEMLDLIADKSLHVKVVDAWMLGIARGGWESVDQLKSMPFTLVTDTKGINFVEHTLAVTEGALALAKAQRKHYAKMPYAIDMDRLVAGGLLHDVGKLVEVERRPDGTHARSRSGALSRHPVSGAILCAQAGLPEEIVNVVACHASEGEGRPQVVETVLIHQADFATFDPLVMMTRNILVK
jgi:putative nucleotidyltransferase with HDIG domain